MSFKKVERSYFSSPSGWRLATYDEVKNGLKDDKVQSLLNKWDRVRLLDGWILGPGYDFQRGKDLQIGNDFRGCLGFMLLIRTQSGERFTSGSTYEDVHLSDFGREAALFLCVDDWNYEVVYWLLNSWSNSIIMDFADVSGGTLQFSDPAEFKKRNQIMGDVARRLGKKVGDALETSGKTKYCGLDSVKHVLSDMIEFVTEEPDIVQLIGDSMWEFSGYNGDEYCLPLSVEHDDVDVAFWSFICESFAGYVVEVSARTSLKKIRDMKTVATRKRDFNIASSILLYLSDYRSDIIHAPLAHKCLGSCAEKILKHAAEKATDEGQHFKQILQNNPMWRCYDDSRNYHLLNKLLIILAKGKYTDMQEEEQRVDSLVVDRLLECGAQHGPAYAIGKEKCETALHHAATSEDERYGMQVAQRLLRKCDLVDATDKRGRTALHRASKKGNAGICRLLVDKGATVTLQDVDSKTALHYVATCFFEDEGLNVAKTLLEKCDDNQGGKFMNAPDKKGRTALHRASKNGKSRMCQLFLDNSAAVDSQNKDGKTALHYAATSYYPTGMKVAECLLGKLNGNQRKELANTTDKKGRTALHRAVERGKASICQLLLRYGARVDALDTSGKSPIDIAVADENIKLAAMLLSKSEEPESYFDKISPEDLLRRSLLDGYETIVQKLFKNRTFLPDAEDGKTALHLAVMGDNENSAMELVWMVLSELCNSEETQKKLVAKPDKNGRTVLHEAALKGYLSMSNYFLRMDPDIIYVKSRNGRNPLYDAVEGNFKGVDMLQKLLKAYLKKDRHVDDLIDSRGGTPLHVAISKGKTELVTELLSKPKIKEKCLSKGDIFGRTSLHEASKLGDSKTVAILLEHGAHPLNERDCDGRTALHYVVQSEKEENKEELAKSIVDGCKSDEEKLLLLWASAAGLGTADEYLNHAGPLYTFLERKKEEVKEKLGTSNLLKMAASLGNTEMAKELITRGYQIEDIREEWSSTLPPEIKEKVDRVSKQIENIREQGNDQPAISDNLGRSDYAQGLAALFLNPYLKPPIAVGISGSWGMGKSSLMVQTESLLLTTAAQMALLKSSKLSDSALNLPDIKPVDLSKKGKIKYKKIERQIIEEIDRHRNHGHNVKKTMFTGILRVFQAGDGHNRKKTLEDFLNKYDPKYHKVFKSLAAMDSSHMFTRRTGEDHETQRSLLKYIWDMVKFKTHATQQETNAQQSIGDGSVEGYVPAVLTVRYNAWKYRSDIEALAGMAVEITKEIEGTMTNAQWLNTCWRNTWKKKKYTIFIEIIFPCLLTIALALSVSLVLWLVLDRYKSKEWAKAKYASLPIALVTTAWTITKSVMGILKPVSTQLMNYISFPDHSDKLGYQERVISDITFLKDEIGKSPHWLFTVLAWFFTTLAVLWRLITESWVTSMLFNHSQHETSMEVPQVAPASGNNLRIIVFVDDLDRCNESVILQVLSAVSLVLAVCEINVVIGMDKRLIERAIIKKYGDVKGNKSSKASEDIADMYLQKIIQLPLDLPDPSEEQAELFLKGQLGVLEEKEIKDKHSIPADTREEEAIQQNTTAAEFTINMGPASSSRERRVNAQTENEAPSQRNVEKIINDCNARKAESSILIRELLFVRYSRGEQNAFCYFQKLSTVYRKLPREWKRFLNYHRLVWYIFSVSKEAMVLFGWQVQLITWIFICWEWKDNMNFIIENWRKIPMLKSIESNPPSLLMIVEYFMEEDEKNKNKEITTTTTPVEGNVAKNSGIKKPESSSNETEESLEAGDDKIGIKKQAGEDNAKITDDVDNKEHEKLETLEKTLAELKKEMKEFKERVSDEFMKVMKELTKEVSDELKKDITELKQQMVIKKVGKNEKTMEEKKRYLRIVHWEKMKLALERYDVPMDGIQAFQRFRFYCIAGYLPQHLSRGI